MLAALVGSGCAPGGAVPEKPKPKAEVPQASADTRKLYTGPVEATIRERESKPGALRPILYKIKGQGSQILYTEEGGAIGGRLEDVSGELFEAGKKSATFMAGVGIADRETQRLNLQGKVNVESESREATLTCDSLVWDALAKRIEAKGSVRVETENGVVGPMDELWATPDLKTVGTPESFKKR